MGGEVQYGIYQVVSAAVGREQRLEVISNNLANVSTVGFKRGIPSFEGLAPIADQRTWHHFSSCQFEADLHGQFPRLPCDTHISPVSAVLSSVEPTPTFGMLSQVVTDFSGGPIRTTGEPLDLAIEGDGFFAVQTPAGIRYTRGGSFTRDLQGQVVTNNGYPVLGEGGGEIILPPGEILIGPDGKISILGDDQGSVPTEVATLPVYTFGNMTRLRQSGDTLFETVGEAPVVSAEARVRQGALEHSNVDPVKELVSMISVFRLYEASQKAIHTADEVAGKAANEVGRLA